MVSAFRLFGTGLTEAQRKGLSALGVIVEKFNKTALPKGSVLVGPKFDGQNLGPDYVPVRLYEPNETVRGAYRHEVNLGNGLRIRELFKCHVNLLNQQRAHQCELSLSEAEDILHWGDQAPSFRTITSDWSDDVCTICLPACLEILTARSLEMIRYSCPDPSVLEKEFKDKSWMRKPGPYITFHVPGCRECSEIVRTLTQEAEDASTRERLAKFFAALSESQFSSGITEIEFNSEGLRAEITLDKGFLEVVIYEGENFFTSPDKLRMIVEYQDGTWEDSSVNDRRDTLRFVIGRQRTKKLPFRLKFIPVEEPEP